MFLPCFFITTNCVHSLPHLFLFRFQFRARSVFCALWHSVESPLRCFSPYPCSMWVGNPASNVEILNTVLTIQHQLTILEGWDYYTMVDGWMIQWRTLEYIGTWLNIALFLDPSLVGGNRTMSHSCKQWMPRLCARNHWHATSSGVIEMDLSGLPFFWQVFLPESCRIMSDSRKCYTLYIFISCKIQ